eukprot:scaffold4958_cov406-Prasinococcus_capsulatus_cf.AAC.8
MAAQPGASHVRSYPGTAFLFGDQCCTAPGRWSSWSCTGLGFGTRIPCDSSACAVRSPTTLGQESLCGCSLAREERLEIARR